MSYRNNPDVQRSIARSPFELQTLEKWGWSTIPGAHWEARADADAARLRCIAASGRKPGAVRIIDARTNAHNRFAPMRLPKIVPLPS
jgi:hypothetical protein